MAHTKEVTIKNENHSITIEDIDQGIFMLQIRELDGAVVEVVIGEQELTALRTTLELFEGAATDE